jgi:hypothetical protein
MRGGGQASKRDRRRKSKFSLRFPKSLLCWIFDTGTATRGGKEKADMDAEAVPRPARPEPDPHTKALRRERISRLRLSTS